MTSVLFEASAGRELLPGVRHATVRSDALGHRADLSTVHVPGTVPAAMVLGLQRFGHAPLDASIDDRDLQHCCAQRKGFRSSPSTAGSTIY